MAMAARSICVGSNARVRPGLGIDETFNRQNAVPFRVVEKLWPTSRNPRYFQLNINSSRKFQGLGSKGSRLLCRRTEDASSLFALSTNKAEDRLSIIVWCSAPLVSLSVVLYFSLYFASSFKLRRMVKYLVEKLSHALKEWRHTHLIKVIGFLACALMFIPSANAVDALKTCACLLKECRIELAKCIANASCAANVACLQTCNNRPDETECQIKCGDLFENSVVDEFNECAVSRKKCVPRKSDVGEFPVPDPAVLVKSFDIANFSGKWFITSGLNPTFDTFDCQLHEFHTESEKLVGNITWRIRTPDGGFFTRSTLQRFVQDPKQPGILYNHDNEYLHYQDDWYILSSKVENKPDDYIFVYYRGRNDAWDGYGGAVVYTRSSVLPESIVPELERAANSVGLDFKKFIRTDNTCGPEPPLVERLEKTIEEGERTIVKEVEQIEEEVEKEVEQIEEQVEKVGKTELTLFQRLLEGLKVLKQDEENFLRGLSKEEMEILDQLKMEASEVESLFGRALPIRKLR